LFVRPARDTRHGVYGTTRNINDRHVENNIQRAVDQRRTGCRGQLVAHRHDVLRGLLVAQRTHQPVRPAARRMDTHGVRVAGDHVHHRLVGDAGVVLVHQRLEQLEAGCILTHVAAGADLGQFLAQVAVAAEQDADLPGTPCKPGDLGRLTMENASILSAKMMQYDGCRHGTLVPFIR